MSAMDDSSAVTTFTAEPVNSKGMRVSPAADEEGPASVPPVAGVPPAGSMPEVLAAALLHDTVEDTDTMPADIADAIARVRMPTWQNGSPG